MRAEKALLKASRAQILLAFAAVYIIWGSTYLGIRFAIETLPPFLMAGARFMLAGAILFVFQRPRSGAKLTGRHWRSAAIIGFLLVMIGNGAVVWAEQAIPSGIAALVVAITPCWIVLIDWLWAKNEKPTLRTAAGLLLGFGGILLLIGPGLYSDGGVNVPGVLAVTAGTMAWAAGSIYSRHAPLPEPQLLATGMEMLCGGALLVLLSFVVGEPGAFDIAAVSMRSWLAFFYLTIFGSLVAFSAYIWLLRVVEPALVSTYAYVNPLVAVALGWALAGEALSARMGLAAAVILAGVILITLRGAKKEEPGASAGVGEQRR